MHLDLGTPHLVRKSALLLVAAVSMATIMVSQSASATTPASHSAVSPSIAKPHFSGSPGTVAAAPTADGKGFWTVTSAGAVSVQGDATLYGDASAFNLNGWIVSIAPTFDGRGYWLLGSDGGVFGFGDAAFHGSTGALGLNSPALQMVSTPDSRGYWFVAGDAAGYWIIGDDGNIYSYGSAANGGGAAPPASGGGGITALSPEFLGETSTVSCVYFWDCQDRIEIVNGTTYTQSLVSTTYPSAGSIASAEWNLGRVYNQLIANIGVSDSSGTGTRLRFQIFGDGVQIYTRDMGIGQEVPINVHVSNVLRLQLEVTVLVAPTTNGIARGVFGSAYVTP